MRVQLICAVTVAAFLATAAAATLKISSGFCIDGSCGPGSPASGAEGIFPGATGIGSGASDHVKQPPPGFPGAALNVFMSAAATEDFGVFRGIASLNAFGDPVSALPGDAWSAAAAGTDTETWTITGGTGTGHLTLSWTVTGSASPLTSADVGGVAEAFGDPVPNAVIMSDAGTVESTVPEPGGFLSTVAGIGVIWLLARCRRRELLTRL